jgi:folate-dependent phosphoribosylglycinamide formyltransferase PurN
VGEASPTPAGRVLLLAGPGDTTDIVANYLSPRVPDLEVVVEDGPSRVNMARRRAKRLGWSTVAGQVLFAGAVLPLLRYQGRARIGAIESEFAMDPTPYVRRRKVDSVNSPETVALIQEVGPDVIVVNGTRIIARSVLDSLSCPIINTHAGITPGYRGVHGGYWALADGRVDQVGTTVHLVDPGIDTGSILAQATFTVSGKDSIATYPYLHLAAGLPLLAEQVDTVLAGRALDPRPEKKPAVPSTLRLHPTVGQYVKFRISRGVR